MRQELVDDEAYSKGPAQDMRLRWMHTVLAERGNVSVYCRVRPLIDQDRSLWKSHLEKLAVGDHKAKGRLKEFKASQDADVPTSIELNGKSGLVLRMFDTVRNEHEKGGKFYSYDKVFGPESTQEEVYRPISDLVSAVLDGGKVCIFAYG